MTRNILVYGCGGVGNELAELLSNDSRYHFIGFIDDNSEIKTCMGFDVYSLEDAVKLKSSVIISIGEPAIREAISKNISHYGLREATVDFSDHFNPKFSVVELGTLLHKGSYISVHTNIGKCCMINKCVLVGYGCTIGSYSVLAPHVTLGGDVTIGNSTYIGSNASIRNGIKIGKNAIIGIGSVVVDDVEDEEVVVGNPARVIRKTIIKEFFFYPLPNFNKKHSISLPLSEIIQAA